MLSGAVMPGDGASAFVQSQLHSGEPQLPQSDFMGGVRTGVRAGQTAAGFMPGGGIADAAGYLGGPSIRQNIGDGNYGLASLQALGIGADALQASAPFTAGLGGLLGTAVKGSLIPKMAMAMVPAAKAGQRAAKNVKKTAIGGVFDNVTDYDEAMRMSQRGDHLKQSADGAYVGAPEGVNSPSALGAMRRNVDAKVNDGMFNATWYDRARDTGAELSGFDPATMSADSPQGALASMFSRGGAAYSPQAAPSSEMNYFLNQHNNKMLTGEDFRAKTNSQMNNVAKAYTPNAETGGFDIDPSKIKLGKKTGPYADAKDATVPDKSLYKTANDIWHGRVFGYQNADGSKFDRAFTPQEHGFLTGENLLAAERANKRIRGIGDNGGPALEGSVTTELTPRSMQAATWGSERRAQKAAAEQSKMKAAQKALDKWQRAKDAGKPAGPKPRLPPMSTDQQLIDYASFGIDNAVQRHRAMGNYEYIPGHNTGHGTGMPSQPLDVRQEYTDRLKQNYGERDPYYDALQMYQYPTADRMGVYKNSAGEIERNPGLSAQPLLELQNQPLPNGKRGGPGVDGTAGWNAMKDIEFLRTAINANEGGGGLKFTDANASMKGAEQTGGQFGGSPEQLDALAGQLQDQGFFTERLGNQLTTGVYPDFETGNRMVNGAAVDGKGIQSAIAKTPGVEGLSYTPGRSETFYEGVPWANDAGQPNPDGTVTQAIIDRLNNSSVPNLAQRLDAHPTLRQSIGDHNMIDKEVLGALGLPENQKIYKLREIISQHGLQGLEGYVKKYGPAGLPAFLLPTIMGGSGDGQNATPYQPPGL